MNIKTRSLIVIGLSIILTSLVITTLSYNSQKKQLARDLDSKLESIATMANSALPKNYHSKITDSNSVSKENYLIVVDSWNKLCKKLDLEFIWSLMKFDGKLHFTSGTAISKTLAEGDYADFFEVHSNPELYEASLNTGQTQYQVNSDKWGTIRAVLVPFKDDKGRTYIVGASMKMSDLALLKKSVFHDSMQITLIVLAIGFALSYILASALAKPMVELTKMTDTISNGNYTGQLPVKGSTECQSLTISINNMAKSIHDKVTALDSKNIELSDEISTRIETEAKLRESENNLSITLHSIGDGVIVTDENGCITRMNPIAETFTGWSIKDALGKTLPEVFHIINAFSRKMCENPVEKVLETGRIVGLANHTTLIAKDKTEYQIADSGAPIRDKSGKIIGVVLVFQNVTEQYELQDQLHQSQKLDSLGRLAGGVAHDFNNMLAGIMGSSELLAKQLNGEENAMTLVTLIQKSARRAAELTKKLLDFSRKGQLLTRPSDVHDSIEHAIDILKHAVDRRISFDLQLGAKDHILIGDPSQLQNAFLNFGVNACDAMPDGGKLSIKSFNVTFDETYTTSNAVDIEPGDYIEVQIKDTGTGISDGALAHIFEPFYTTKDVGEGTGLGLASAYGTIKEHKGHIDVHTEMGEGTTFHIFIPIDKSLVLEEPKPPVTLSRAEANSGSQCVLLVDDDDQVRDTTAAMLEDMSYDVIEARNGLEALEHYKASRNKIDAVVLDAVMPVMNGGDCFKKLREMNPNASIILCSGYSRDIAIKELKKEGNFEFISKPYESAQLETALTTLISGNTPKIDS